MRHFFFFVFVLFLFVIPASLYVQTQSMQPTTDKTRAYTDTITIASPREDAVVNGDFTIQGTAAPLSDKVKSVEIILTQLYDKRQQTVKMYEASYDPATAQWSARVEQGDLPDDVYTLRVEVEAEGGEKQIMFSTIVVNSDTTSGENAVETI